MLNIRVSTTTPVTSMIQCWTMAIIGNERGVRRIKSWIFKDRIMILTGQPYIP